MQNPNVVQQSPQNQQPVVQRPVENYVPQVAQVPQHVPQNVGQNRVVEQPVVERVVPPTPNPTPTPMSAKVEAHSDQEIQQLITQLQIEQSSHELTRKKLDYFAEEKALLMKEISTQRFQIENLNKMKNYMSQSLEQHSQHQSKYATELAKLQQNLEQEKNKLHSDIEKEKTAQVELSGENSQLKTRLDSVQESYNIIAVDRPQVLSTYETDKNSRIQLETENAGLREKWNNIQKELEKDRSENVIHAREVQELKRQAKALESSSSSVEELNFRVQSLEKTLNEEQEKRKGVETNLKELHRRYNELYSTYFKQYQLLEATLSSIKLKISSFPPEFQSPH
jgi:chromosome segregation ATPase